MLRHVFFAVLRLAVDATLLRCDALFDVWTVSGDKLFIDALLLLRCDALFDEVTVSGDTLFTDLFSFLSDIFYILSLKKITHKL